MGDVSLPLPRPETGSAAPAGALRTPVLLAGAGVSGSLTALELAHHGVPSIVLERASSPSRLADLILISGRGMELLRRLRLAAAVRACGVDPDRPADIVWSQGIDRPPVLVWRLPSVTEMRPAYAAVADGSAPIEPYLLISGPALTARLRQALADNPLIDLRTGWTLTDARSEPDGVVATVIEAGTGARHIVEATYLAGCDGAQSTVRRCAGLSMETFGRPAPHFTIYFRDAGLAGRWPRPSALITGGGTLVSGHDGDMCVAHLPIAADEQTGFADPADLLQQRFGLPAEQPEIVAVVHREGASAVARDYRRGRVFLAGRAAHQSEPPGNDVDTCIGDAIDLGWRLAATVHGWAGEQLLAGYQAERRPQALLDRELAQRALQTRRRFQRMVDAGANQEVLVDLLRQEPPQLDPAGTGPAGLAVKPGFRSPAFRLSGGAQLFDRLGPQFTLVDLTHDRDGWPLVAAARSRGIPIRHLPVAGAPVPTTWPDRLVLIRPDQQVAWRGDHLPPDCDGVLDAVAGARRQVYENT
jgi:2-polyprenyl-6-methoxyphenol hydroxylase-like FAD-dependent oxidoreductase